MALNQLFCKRPDIKILDILLKSFDLKSLEDTKVFTKKDLVDLNTVEEINKNKNIFKSYYLPCKANKYLNNLNEKKVLTILKQIVRTFDFYVFSKEKVRSNEKIITYQIVPLEKKKILNIKKKNQKYVVNFD